MRTITTASHSIKCIKNDITVREFEVKFFDNSGVGKTDQELIDMCDNNNFGGYVTKYSDNDYIVTVWID